MCGRLMCIYSTGFRTRIKKSAWSAESNVESVEASLVSRWKHVRPGWILALMILAGWLIGVLGDRLNACPPSLGSNYCFPITDFLGQNNAFVVYDGTYWQIFTSIFVTDSIVDAGFNALAVLILDRFIEPALNKPRYFLIFFLCAFLGNLVTLLQGPQYASAGASGGIFGLFAATFSYSWAVERKVDFATLGFFLVLFIGSSFLLPNINWLAHVGGSLGGFIAGPLLAYSMRNNLAKFERVSQSSILFSLAILVLIAVATGLSAIGFAIFVLG
jgi:rhomboid protease GluP